MKLLPLLVLNVAVVAGGIFVYDQLRSEAPPAVLDVQADSPDLSSIHARLARLEAERRPGLSAAPQDTALVERVAALERLVGALREAGAVEPGGAAGTTPSATPDPAPAGSDDPSPEAVQRFRKLQAAARREEKRKHTHQWIEKTLTQMQVSLTPEQTERLVGTYLDFEPRRDEIWTEAKTRGAAQGTRADWKTIIRDTSAVVRREFVERTVEFLSTTDAEAVAAELYPSK